MAEKPMIGARCPEAWQEKIKNIAQLTGRTEADVVREALGQYLGLVDPKAVKRALDDHEERLSRLEAKLGRLAG
ncbi:hypothetical protein [Calothrix sp. 336/3]|uniref:hypothetical protein n=1 Tax=Calothrix sp. 336/3 TaxID=1337936 RepID=UPI0004E3F7AA|nr:hypothetical protein [Calothrix sp. 336/3]AKG24939.1 hypothetical protein IJ00_26730 [Calothrix sp. 336/3]